MDLTSGMHCTEWGHPVSPPDNDFLEIGQVSTWVVDVIASFMLL